MVGIMFTYKDGSKELVKQPEEDNKKYYTPDISEWYVGFEYEQRREEWDKEYPGVKVLQYIWEPVVANLGSEKGSLYQFKEGIDPERKEKHYRFTNGILEYGAYSNMVRIKYLDKEDIESLGFVFKETNNMRSWYIKEQIYERLPGGSTYTYWSMSIEHDPDMKIIKITANVDGTIESFFEGSIKNKSELKVLLKQLGIDE